MCHASRHGSAKRADYALVSAVTPRGEHRRVRNGLSPFSVSTFSRYVTVTVSKTAGGGASHYETGTRAAKLVLLRADGYRANRPSVP